MVLSKTAIEAQKRANGTAYYNQRTGKVVGLTKTAIEAQKRAREGNKPTVKKVIKKKKTFLSNFAKAPAKAALQGASILMGMKK